MSNSTVTNRSGSSNSSAPTHPISCDSARGRESLSQGIGSQLELIKAFTLTSGFWARWFRYLVLLALAVRILHHSGRIFKHYGSRLFQAVKRFGGWAKGGGDNGRHDRQQDDRHDDHAGKARENQDPPSVCAVCHSQLSRSSQKVSPSSALIPSKQPLLRNASPTFSPAPPSRSYTAPLTSSSRPASRACSAPLLLEQERRRRTTTTTPPMTRKKNFRNDRPLFR
ncbi:hypothetical protein PG990_003341 [Apiospora arundinis]